jgi:excisionase family DNA binding protein
MTSKVPSTTAPAVPRLLTTREAAEVLAISERHLARLVAAGVIVAVRLGHAVRFTPEDVQAAIARQRGAAPADVAGAKVEAPR